MLDFVALTGAYVDLSEGFDSEPFIGFVTEKGIALYIDVKHGDSPETKAVFAPMFRWTHEELMERIAWANFFPCGRVKVVIDETYRSIGELIDMFT